MATDKPRITVTLEPEHYAVLSEMARVTKSTKSSIVAGLVAESAPILARVVKLLAEAEAMKASVGERVRELATEAELEMLPMASAAAKTFDMFESQIMEAIARAKASDGRLKGGTAK